MDDAQVITDRYRLDREVGRGGMGAVWQATDVILDRPVALKRLLNVPGTGSVSRRAAREAQLAARLVHPNVVGVYDLVEDDRGDPWLVMEYVEGTTLAEVIASRGPLRPAAAANILSKVAAALIAAHDAGIVHRDVKPSNILLASAGTVKLTDFGIARSADGDQTLTQTGLVTGSPAYLSPEVASGQPATAASDVWSLGATLYFALTGTPPYEVGENVLGTLYRIVHDEPPRTEKAGYLAPVLAGAMTRDVGRRWSMAEVLRGLTTGPDQVDSPTAPLTATGAAVPPPSPPASAPVSPERIAPEPQPESRRRVLPVLVAAVAIIAAVAVGMFLLGSRGDDEPAAHASSQQSSPPARRPAPSEKSTPSQKATQKPTAQGVRNFITDYLNTAGSDPETAFGMLTPDFQVASGGLEGYRGFWDGVDQVKQIHWIRPELSPDLGVTYRYSYTYRGRGVRTETISLRLVMRDGRYLIAGE